MHQSAPIASGGGSRQTRVTINDVADRTGLSKGTVSRALNGYPDIAEATRLRVTRTAERMGYVPMANAQAIRTGRNRSLGLVLQISEPDAHRPFLADFLAGVTGAASRERWTLTVATAQDEAEAISTMARLIDERKADGFILPRTKIRDARAALCLETGVPFVMFGRTGDPEGCAWFDILGEDAMAAAVDRLCAHGHRQIGFINGGDAYNYSALRLTGFERGMAARGLTALGGHLGSGAVTIEQGASEARRILCHPTPPTAIVCATDMCALGVYRAAGELGLEIGQDLSVIGYDGIPESGFADPPLTTFRVDSRAAGARLATLLIRRIRGEAPEMLRELAPATLIDGGSDGPPPAIETITQDKKTQGRT